MMPGRYAKSEASSGFLGALDTYVYRAPLSQAPGPTAEGADTTPAGEPAPSTTPAPSTVDAGLVEHATPR
jgi:hypothetical protein